MVTDHHRSCSAGEKPKTSAGLVSHWIAPLKGGGKALDEAAPAAADLSNPASPLADIFTAEPSPYFAVQMVGQFQGLLHFLGDGELQSVVPRKVEGYTLEEIAAQLGWVPRTGQHRLW